METQKIRVKLEGLSSIMFDRFIDHSVEATARPPEQKMYLDSENRVTLPSDNIDAFLWGDNPAGCAKVFEKKGAKDYLRIGLGHIFIDPAVIPFQNNKGGDIIFNDFDGKILWCHKGSPRVMKGSRSIKVESKTRPALTPPWSLEFVITMVQNALIDEHKLYNWFMAGGLQVALGTYRPKYGRFTVEKWDVIE